MERVGLDAIDRESTFGRLMVEVVVEILIQICTLIMTLALLTLICD